MRKLFIVLAILVSSCHKDVGPATQADWQNCREKVSKNTIAKKLVGDWKLIATGCAECLNPGVRPADKEVTLSFAKDGKSVVEQEKGMPTVTTEYKLMASYNEGFYKIETKPPYNTHYIYGIVEFCKGSFALKNSYVDGPDFYFERVK